MAKDPISGFEIPAEMRNMAEQSVDQAKKAFDGFMSAAHQAVTAIEGQTTAAQAGAKDVGRKAMSFAEQNVAASFDFAHRLVRAKDPQEVLRLQAEFMKAQMETLTAQAKELGESAGRVASEAAKPKI
jgi:phasin